MDRRGSTESSSNASTISRSDWESARTSKIHSQVVIKSWQKGQSSQLQNDSCNLLIAAPQLLHSSDIRFEPPSLGFQTRNLLPSLRFCFIMPKCHRAVKGLACGDSAKLLQSGKMLRVCRETALSHGESCTFEKKTGKLQAVILRSGKSINLTWQADHLYLDQAE